MTGAVATWQERNTYCSEPAYLEEPGVRGEDSGLILCSLLWAKPRYIHKSV